ncbi:MAG: hypothetical protein Fur006_22250 [Coleofasciculaceae cyanobacterium]
MSPVRLLPTALYELFATATVSGRLTVADRYGLMAALLEESLVDEEIRVINRLLYAVRKGRIAVVDEISCVL